MRARVQDVAKAVFRGRSDHVELAGYTLLDPALDAGFEVRAVQNKHRLTSVVVLVLDLSQDMLKLARPIRCCEN